MQRLLLYSITLISLPVVIQYAEGLSSTEAKCIGEDGREGTCVRFEQCPQIFEVALRIIYGQGTDDDEEYVRRSLCSIRTLVCCLNVKTIFSRIGNGVTAMPEQPETKQKNTSHLTTNETFITTATAGAIATTTLATTALKAGKTKSSVTLTTPWFLAKSWPTQVPNKINTSITTPEATSNSPEIVTKLSETDTKLPETSTKLPETAIKPPKSSSNLTTAMKTNEQIGRSLLPSNCGYRIDMSGLLDIRIVGGERVLLGTWPWMALLRAKTTNNETSWLCGGTLISDRYVLTAAHCFTRNLDSKIEFVRLGEHNLAEDPECDFVTRSCTSSQDIKVERVVIHPSYGDPCEACNDIAIVKLAHSVNLTRNNVAAICLPFSPESDLGYPLKEFLGKRAKVAGWGSMNPYNHKMPDILQETRLTIRENRLCDFMKKNYTDNPMVICAGDAGRDTCKGDSGGPLMLSHRYEPKYFLVGITSVGFVNCGSRHSLGLYTSVHYYMDWILNNLI